MTEQQDNQQGPPQDHRPFFELTLDDISARVRELLSFLPTFFKNPVETIKHVPSWDWPTVVILEVFVAAITAVLGGIVGRNFLAMLGGLFVGPIMGLLLSFITAGILYYAVLFAMKTEIEYRKVFIVVVLSKLLPHCVEVFAPLSRAPVHFAAIVLTAVFINLGLVYNFMLEKKKTFQIVGALTAMALLMWAYTTVVDVTTKNIKVQDYTPESLDQIHKELNEGH
jgi:hypothetical protein